MASTASAPITSSRCRWTASLCRGSENWSRLAGEAGDCLDERARVDRLGQMQLKPGLEGLLTVFVPREGRQRLRPNRLRHGRLGPSNPVDQRITILTGPPD